MDIPYHFRGQKPHCYKHDDGSIRVSSLIVDINDLYPPGFVEKHGDNAKTMLMSMSYGQRLLLLLLYYNYYYYYYYYYYIIIINSIILIIILLLLIM